MYERRRLITSALLLERVLATDNNSRTKDCNFVQEWLKSGTQEAKDVASNCCKKTPGRTRLLERILCSRDSSRIERMYLGGLNLEGSIPANLGELEALIVLDLSHNSLSGNIPESIGQLTALESLRLNGNHLLGKIPPQIGLLINLKGINLNDNRLKGGIPPEVGLLGQLTVLQACSNNLNGEIPKELFHATGISLLLISDF